MLLPSSNALQAAEMALSTSSTSSQATFAMIDSPVLNNTTNNKRDKSSQDILTTQELEASK